MKNGMKGVPCGTPFVYAIFISAEIQNFNPTENNTYLNILLI